MTSQYIWVQDSDSLKKEQWRSDKRGIRYYTKHQVIAILLLPKSTFKAIMLDFSLPKINFKNKELLMKSVFPAVFYKTKILSPVIFFHSVLL